MKTMHNSDASGTRVNVPDVQFFGDGDTFKLICKASSESEGWMKSTKALDYGGGCIVQTTTQQRNPDGSYALADTSCNVPGITICEQYDDLGDITGRFLTTSDAEMPYVRGHNG